MSFRPRRGLAAEEKFSVKQKQALFDGNDFTKLDDGFGLGHENEGEKRKAVAKEMSVTGDAADAITLKAVQLEGGNNNI